VNGIGNGSVALANVAITGGTISGNTTASNVTVSSGTFTNVTLSNVTISSVSTPITAAEGGTGSSSAFTTNGVAYATSTSALATGSALTFDGTNLGISNAAPSFNLDIGNTSATSNFTQRIVSGASYAAMSRYDLSGTGTFTVGFNNSGSVVNNAPSGVASLWMQQNYPLVFGVNASEQMRLNSTGLGIGTNVTNALVNSNSLALNVTSGYEIINHISGSATGSTYIYFGYNAGVIGSIIQNGTTGVLYNLTSDYRLKNNPVPVTGAKEFIMGLQPKSWDWWDGSGKGVGFIAHEFMEVAKYSGHGEKDAVDADGKPVYQSIQPSSSEVMANLVALVQELTTEVTALKAKLGV